MDVLRRERGGDPIDRLRALVEQKLGRPHRGRDFWSGFSRNPGDLIQQREGAVAECPCMSFLWGCPLAQKVGERVERSGVLVGGVRNCGPNKRSEPRQDRVVLRRRAVVEARPGRVYLEVAMKQKR